MAPSMTEIQVIFIRGCYFNVWIAPLRENQKVAGSLFLFGGSLPCSVRKENLPSKIPSFALWGGTWTRLMLDQKLPYAVCSSMPFLVLQCLPGWWDWVGRIEKCLRRQSESWHPSRYYCNMVESRTSQLSLDTDQSVKTISTPVSVVSHLMF